MSKGMKALLMGIIAVIVVVILISAYFAMQPKVKWWTPEKEMKKPDVDFDGLNSTILFERAEKDIESLNLLAGHYKEDRYFGVGAYVFIEDYLADFNSCSLIGGNLTVWAERVSGDYILQKLVIEYSYGENYTGVGIPPVDGFAAKNLWFDVTPNRYGGTNLYYEWHQNHRMVGVNKDANNGDFYGVSFPIELTLEDSISENITHTITFTVTAYYGHPSLLGWRDMHEVKTQVVLKIVPGGEKE